MGAERAVWTVKGGRYGERVDRLLASNVIGGGWEQLPSLEHVDSKEKLAEIYRAAYPDMKSSAAANYVGQLWSLVHRMQEGELVVLSVKTTGTIAVGRIAGPYQYRDDLGEDLHHCRPVTWLATDIPRDAFDQDLLFSFGAFLTFGRVKRENAEARVLAAIEGRTTRLTVRLSPSAAEADQEESVEDAPDIEALAREQVRQHVSQVFAGHELADLVGHVLGARGYSSVSVSPPGADRGVDILAGSGPLGLDRPRLAVQVKTGQAGVEEYRALRGVMQEFGADHGLLVAWSGFKGTVRNEARTSHFTIRLWDADALLNELFRAYDGLPDLVRSQLPLKRVLALVPDTE
jgi:restriction system protein